MIKFFRKIRQRLLTENKFSKYLIYAIGEIILVVIGILIALSLNNWNEQKKNRVNELQVLENLRKEIYSNIGRLSDTKNYRENVIKIDHELLNQIKDRANTDTIINIDSLLYYVLWSGWKFFPETGVLTDILNSGKLGLIQNDSLRYLISSLPGRMKTINDEDDTYRIDLHGYYVPFFGKNYPVRNIMEGNKDLQNSEYNAYQKSLLTNREFENILFFQKLWTGTSVHMYKGLISRYDNIIRLIEEELVDN